MVGGRFLVIFLEHEAGLSSAELGSILALSQMVHVVASSATGGWAVALESRHPDRGRACMLAGGIVLGGGVFLLHGLNFTSSSSSAVLYHGFLRVLFAVSNAMVFPVLDGMSLDYLQSHGSKQDFGKKRLYGAVSWGIANVIVAWGLDHYYPSFQCLYWMAVISTIVALIVIFLSTRSQVGRLHSRHDYRKRNSDIILKNDCERNDEDDEKPEDIDDVIAAGPGSLSLSSSTSAFSLLFLLATSWFRLEFILAQISQSYGQAIVDNLVFLYFELLGSSYTLMGLSVVLTVAFEIPIFHIAPNLLQRWGPGPLVPIAAFSYIVRVWGYSLIPQGQVIHILWLEPLHGVTYACMATAGVDLISSLVLTPGQEASGQSALQVLVGTIRLGLVLGGILGRDSWAKDHVSHFWCRCLGGMFIFYHGFIPKTTSILDSRWDSDM